VAVASAGPYANHLHLAPDRYHASTFQSIQLKVISNAYFVFSF